ncbi:hypothetical protein CBM2585_A10050 [Cupriavidus taiwanensis]|nr:hypothetical protein CBM2585_A10050 [Cupriavidus taiwanensis]
MMQDDQTCRYARLFLPSRQCRLAQGRSHIRATAPGCRWRLRNVAAIDMQRNLIRLRQKFFGYAKNRELMLSGSTLRETRLNDEDPECDSTSSADVPQLHETFYSPHFDAGTSTRFNPSTFTPQQVY